MLPITLIYLALSHVATAQNATNTTTPECEGEVGVYNSFNITNSTIIPAFEPPGFSPANWTLNFGVSDIRNATDKSSLSEMYMWIDSTDKETDLDSVDLPYTGCIIGYALERRRNSTGDIGTGDGCKGVFTEECYKALVQSATLSASRGLDGGDLKKRCLNALDFTNVKGCDREDGWYAYSSHGTSPLALTPGHALCTYRHIANIATPQSSLATAHQAPTAPTAAAPAASQKTPNYASPPGPIPGR